MADRLERDPQSDPVMSGSGIFNASAGNIIVEVMALLGERRFEEAIVRAETELASVEGSELRALLGTARFLSGDYAGAVGDLEHAIAQSSEHADAPDWREMQAIAEFNAAAGVATDHPPIRDFDRGELLEPPSEQAAALPQTGNTEPRESPLEPVYAWLGETGGKAIDKLWRLLSSHGKSSHRAREGTWTDWYEKPLYPGLFTLAGIREELDEKNLIDTYPKGSLTGFAPTGLPAPKGVEYFRTPDGAWNNLANPKEGAAGTRFPRNVDRERTWPGRQAPLDDPNPAEISRVLFTREAGMKEVPFLNLIAAAWIQFMVHDWVSHRTAPLPPGPVPGGQAFTVALPPDHPARRFHQHTLWVGKTLPNPTRGPADEGTPPTAINEVTSWWDASQIYGSDETTAARLRSREHGKLRLEADGSLPMAGDSGIADTGYSRNWWLGLGLMHTLFAREHNSICDELRLHHPTWGDDRLYGVARLVNAAVMAKIHTVEWTPAILPNPCLSVALGANWHGLLEQWLHRPGHRRVLRRLKLKSPVLGGLVGGHTENFGVPYGMSEEFTEVYRLHELLPDHIAFRSATTGVEHERLSLLATRMKSATELLRRYPMEDLFYSFGNQSPGAIVLNNFPATLQALSIPGNAVYDLGAVDILRARERGVPRYNEFRRRLGLHGIDRFEDLTNDPTTLERLKRIYRDDVELIDMQVGSRAESKRPTGFGFGETLFQVFILNASRRLQADRFYTENYDARTYTKEGLDWIDRATMKSVLLRHFPALEATGLGNVDNAFEPWDVGTLAKARHPLRFLKLSPRWLRGKGPRVKWD